MKGNKEINEVYNDTMILKDDLQSKDQESLADVLYNEITKVIGGDNPEQFFCMGLPGTLLDASQYSYDIDKKEPKPAHVRANESKLTNKLFDACFMTASDNGRHLQTQYRTALNMLTPKLNSKLFDAKTELRKVLMQKYPYNFGDGIIENLTLNQVFYRLYGDYVLAKKEWAQKQLDKKAELERKYPESTEEAYSKRVDQFLEWYGVVAEAEELIVEEKLGKVLSVFSPGDMEIINGILNSGVGREINEARNVLDNVEKANPDGGYVYPVTLYPNDWFNLLDNSFTEVDLLESPAAISQQLHVLEMRRSNIMHNMQQFLQIIPDEEAVKSLQDKYQKCEDTYQKAFSEYITNNQNTTIDMFKTVIDIISENSKDKEEISTDTVSQSTVARVFGVDIEKVSGIIEVIGKNLSDCINSQQNLLEQSDKAVTAALEYFEKNNQLQRKYMLEPFKQQLSEVDEQIKELKQKIAMTSIINKDVSDKDVDFDKNAVAPNNVGDKFTQIIIDADVSSISKESCRETNSSQSSYGVSFLFGGYSSNKSHQDAVSNEFSNNSDMRIQIGMSVAKVGIEREWFNPGVFMLTADMYNTSNEQIAPSSQADFTSDNVDGILKHMEEMNKSILSCYPVSFVIAKDVTIKFSSQTAVSSSFAKSVEEHSSKGGGFFIFGGSAASVSSSGESNSSATSNSHSVTVRFTTPQIIGYYLEAVPADRSVSINSISENNDEFISIFEFIKVFQKMLDDFSQK